MATAAALQAMCTLPRKPKSNSNERPSTPIRHAGLLYSFDGGFTSLRVMSEREIMEEERRRAELEELNRLRTTQRARSQAKKQKPKRPMTAPAPASAPAAQPPESSATDEQLQKAIAELQKEHEVNVQVIKKLYEEKKRAEKRAAYLQKALQTRRSVETSRPASTTGKLLHSKDDIGVAYGRAANAPEHKTRPTRPASASRRRSHQFTIPKPFANMESDIQSRRQKALQRKEEEGRKKAEEQQAEEQERLRKSQVLTTDFNNSAFMQRERERQLRRQQLEQELKLKKRVEEAVVPFKAKPVRHSFSGSWEDIKKKEDAMRAQRIAQRARELHEQASLPPRMETHQQQGFQRSQRTSGSLQKESGSRPQSARRLEPEEVQARFEKQHKRWAMSLENAKHRKAPVTFDSKVATFEQRQQQYAEKFAQRRAAREQKQKEAEEAKKETERKRREMALKHLQQRAPIKFTKAAEKRTEVLRQKMEAEEAAKRQEEERLKQRRLSEKEMAAAIKPILDETERERKAKLNRYTEMQGTEEEARRRAREATRAFRRSLKENKEKLQAAMAMRPTLVERLNTTAAKARAKREALTTVAQTVFEDQWKKAAAADELFDLEEKAKLGLLDDI